MVERNPTYSLLRNIYRGYLERLDRPGWKKFAFSLAALGVAFLLAIYSRIFREDGRLAATAVSATLALLLAGYVAITAVPYLARRSSLRWLRVSIDYKLTREGIAFIVLIFVLAIAGLNTGNNLLYMVLASLLAAILMSGFLSMAVLTGVGLEVMLPDHVFARRPVPARITLRNQKKLMPSFSITLTGGGDSGKKKKRKRKRSSPEPGSSTSHLASTDDPGPQNSKATYLFFFLAGRPCSHSAGGIKLSATRTVSGEGVLARHPLSLWISRKEAALAGLARSVGLSRRGADRRVL